MKRLYTFTQIIIVCLFLFPAIGFSQQTNSFWMENSSVPANLPESIQPLITAKNATYLKLDYELLHSKIYSGDLANFILELPLGNGTFKRFKLTENTLLPASLNDKFPEVRAFNIISTDSRNTWGKFEISPKGIHAMIFQPGKSTFFIDPLYKNNSEDYIAYSRKDFYTGKMMNCLSEDNASENPFTKVEHPKNDFNTCELRTYRLALAVTGEYTVYQGGTAADAFGALVTTINRVNGVYERDLAITMVLVENNDTLIYTDPETDPYTNEDAAFMLSENQVHTDARIGPGNYDIGHLLSTHGDGLAVIRAVCKNGNKARGVTGIENPVGDPFDIDYVAHEIGHQYGGNHSFNNSCNGNSFSGAAVEPGSGSTIMGYAGICAPNIQEHSDDYFHGYIMKYISILFDIEPYTCAVKSPLDNSSPFLAELPNKVYIPLSTPFTLTGHASDSDGDILTYCWEQINAEASTQPPLADSPGGPNFRSLPPSLDSIRYFPNLPDLANGGPFTWEQVPSVPRLLRFRLTVRDNAPGGGCTQWEDMNVITVEGSGPFEVLYPSDTGIEWNSSETETITWDVANTTADPINANSVDIFLSTDGGISYSFLLADDVPNTGSLTVEVPEVTSDEARIMVMNSEGTFFDISDQNFSITSAVGVEESQDQSASIFPNPTRDYLTVKWNASAKIDKVVVLDLLGREIFRETVDGRTFTELNVSAYSPGIYLIRLDGDNGISKVYKFIKQ